MSIYEVGDVPTVAGAQSSSDHGDARRCTSNMTSKRAKEIFLVKISTQTMKYRRFLAQICNNPRSDFWMKIQVRRAP